MAPTETTSADAAAQRQSVRLTRMLQTIKKALDVSVSSASTVNLRAFFEEECKDEPELLAQLFAPAASTADNATSVDQQEHYAGELSALALQALRHRIETAFQELCDKHNINANLLTLEDTIDQAHKAKIQEQAAREFAEAKRKEAEAESSLLADGAPRTSPEELIRNERIRVMEAEKKQLELLVKQLQMKKEEEQTRLNIKREMATNAIEDLRQVSNDMQEATAFAKDYARGADN